MALSIDTRQTGIDTELHRAVGASDDVQPRSVADGDKHPVERLTAGLDRRKYCCCRRLQHRHGRTRHIGPGLKDIEGAGGRAAVDRCDVATAIDCEAGWPAQPSRNQRVHGLAGGVQNLDEVVSGVGDQNIAHGADCDATRAIEARES